MNNTKVYLIRHVECTGNIEKRLTGRTEFEVTKKGEETIRKLTQELKNIKFDVAYSSTASRAERTIKQLADLNNIEIKKLEELQEMYFGIYDGWKWEDVNIVNPSIRQTKNDINEIVGIKGQETMEQVAERMYKTILTICKANQGKNILIGSHGVSIEAFLRKIVNLPFKFEIEKFCQHNGAINEVQYENGGFSITRLADIKYLNATKNKEKKEQKEGEER